MCVGYMGRVWVASLLCAVGVVVVSWVNTFFPFVALLVAQTWFTFYKLYGSLGSTSYRLVGKLCYKMKFSFLVGYACLIWLFGVGPVSMGDVM